MPLSRQFIGNFNSLLNVQEAESIINENERSFEEYLFSELSEYRSLKTYWSSQDVKNNGVAVLEREIQTMIKSIKNVDKVLSETDEIGDVFKTPGEEIKNPETVLNENNLKASFEEIEKMDAILKMKASEEKKAKLSRIQTEEESRDILTSLSCAKMSSGFKINLKEFLRLLNEEEKRQNDFSPFNKLIGLSGFGQDEFGEDKKEKISNHKFVERNIQLAKYGGGTLSLTDEEILRIKNLLVDIEDAGEAEKEADTKIHGNKEIFYAIDEEAKLNLNHIDEKLEVLAKEKKSSMAYQNVMNLSKKVGDEDKVFEEDEKENIRKGSKSNRLNEINKLLSSMNGVSNEEINPLAEEEIRSLVQQSLCLLRSFEPERTCQAEGKELPSYKLSEEVIVELVSSAKLSMPKFKYRFEES